MGGPRAGPDGPAACGTAATLLPTASRAATSLPLAAVRVVNLQGLHTLFCRRVWHVLMRPVQADVGRVGLLKSQPSSMTTLLARGEANALMPSRGKPESFVGFRCVNKASRQEANIYAQIPQFAHTDRLSRHPHVVLTAHRFRGAKN